MKKNSMMMIACLAMLLTSVLSAADKLAIAEPVVKGKMNAEEAQMLWSMLESMAVSAGEGKYVLVSRASLNQMMTEIGLTTSSDLVNLNSTQKAKLGELEGVKYLLISEIGTFGTKLNCTLRILESSTGVIDPRRTITMRCADLDELADKLEWGIEKLFSDEKVLDRSALLNPIITNSKAPSYLAREFNVLLENYMIASGMPLQNLQSVSKILEKNNIDPLEECEPKTYTQIGNLLEVKQLIQATIERFEIVATPYYVAETGAKGVNYTGVMSGSVQIIGTKTGQKLAVMPFEVRMDFRYLDRRLTADWTNEDYGKYMIRTTLSEKVIPDMIKAAGEIKDQNK